MYKNANKGNSPDWFESCGGCCARSIIDWGVTMILVWANAGSIHHHVGNVVLFMDSMKKVGHWSLGEDTDILSTVGLIGKW